MVDKFRLFLGPELCSKCFLSEKSEWQLEKALFLTARRSSEAEKQSSLILFTSSLGCTAAFAVCQFYYFAEYFQVHPLVIRADTQFIPQKKRVHFVPWIIADAL